MPIFSNSMLLSTGTADNLPIFVDIVTFDMSTNPAVVSPPTTAAGDHMLLFVALGGAATSITTPSGWTIVTTDFTANPRVGVYRRIATASEGTVTIQRNNTSQAAGVIVSYRGGSALVDLAGTVFRGVTDTVVAPSITATQTGALLFFSHNSSGAATVITPPAGMTQRIFTARGTLYDLIPQAVGATGSKTTVYTVNTNVAGLLVQIY